MDDLEIKLDSFTVALSFCLVRETNEEKASIITHQVAISIIAGNPICCIFFGASPLVLV